ncbi:Clp protease N-terminal domain-containing protein [Chlorogloeopsis sp. ULAP02]
MLFERLDSQGLKAVLFAGNQVFSQQYHSVGTELILLGLIAQESSDGNETSSDTETNLTSFNSLNFFQNRNITLARVQAAIRDVLVPIDTDLSESTLVVSPPSTQVVEVEANYTIASFAFNEGVGFSERAIRVLTRAEEIADRGKQRFISAFHLLLGLLEEGQELIDGQPSNAVRILEYLGVNLHELQTQVIQTLQHQD